MFDIGFPELLTIAVVALIFIGPKQLPQAVRTIALWIARLQRALADVRAQVEREIGADDIRREIRNAPLMQDLKRTGADLQAMADDTQDAIRDVQARTSTDHVMPDSSLNPNEIMPTAGPGTTPPADSATKASVTNPADDQAAAATDTENFDATDFDTTDNDRQAKADSEP